MIRGRERTLLDLTCYAWQVKEWFTITPSLEQSLGRIDHAGQGYFFPVLRYPDKLMKLLKQADSDGKDVLADFETIQAAWRAVAEDKPLVIRFVAPPSFDVMTGQRLPKSSSRPIN